jgi:CheY-like chemotaxis protein
MSEGPGRGSEFCVEMPLAERAAQQKTVSADAPRLTKVHRQGVHEEGRRILVVDDNEDAAGGMLELLSDIGYDVRAANDGVQALKIVKTFKPDVCLLDIGLPAMDGYELARRLQQSNDLPVGARLIAVTGYGQHSDKRRTAEAGFVGHLVKPVTFDALTGALASSTSANLAHPPGDVTVG